MCFTKNNQWSFLHPDVCSDLDKDKQVKYLFLVERLVLVDLQSSTRCVDLACQRVCVNVSVLCYRAAYFRCVNRTCQHV